jgi:hypothetical protein
LSASRPGRDRRPGQAHCLADRRRQGQIAGEDPGRAAEHGIRALVKRGEPITFQAVQREAGVSHAFLYNHPDLRGRIEHLRARARPDATPSALPESESTLVLALTAQIGELKKRHRHDVQTLRAALEQAHGENLDLRRELAPPGSRHLSPPGPRRIDRNNEVTCKNTTASGPNR